MKELAKAALNQISAYRENPVIMAFVEKNALEQVASDIRAKTGGGTTSKAVELLSYRDNSVKERIEQYIKIGLIAVYAESIGA